jgi:hypothetical protein
MANNSDTCLNANELHLDLLRKIMRSLKDICEIITADEYCTIELLERMDGRLINMDKRLARMNMRSGGTPTDDRPRVGGGAAAEERP